MTETFTEILILDRSIRIRMSDTGCGINLLIEGGDRGHIGAVAVACPGQPLKLIEFPTHREGVICQRWAEAFCERYQVPVVVEAGVHYEAITKDGIQAVLRGLETALNHLLQPERQTRCLDSVDPFSGPAAPHSIK